MKFFRWKWALWAVLGATATLGVSWTYALIWGRPWDFAHFETRVMIETGLQDPEWQTQNNLPHLLYLSAWKFSLTRRSRSSLQSRAALARRQLALLEGYGWKAHAAYPLNRRLQLRRWLELRAFACSLDAANWPIYPETGEPFALMRFLTLGQPVRSNDEAEQYMSRLKWTARTLDEVTEAARDCLRRRVYPPADAVALALKDIDRWLDAEPEAHPLFTAYARQIARADPTLLNRSKGLDYLKDAAFLIRTEIYPALRRMRAMLAEEASPVALVDFKLPERSFEDYMLLWLGAPVATDSFWQSLSSVSTPPLPTPEAAPDTVIGPALARDGAVALEIRYRQAAEWSAGMFGKGPAARPRIFATDAALGLQAPVYYPPSLAGDRNGELVLPPSHTYLSDSAMQWAIAFAWLAPGVHWVQGQLRSDQRLGWAARLGEDPAWIGAWRLYALFLMEDEVKVVANAPVAQALETLRQEAQAAAYADLALHARRLTWRETLDGLARFSLTPEARIRLAAQAAAQPGRYAAVWAGYQELVRRLELARLSPDYFAPDHHQTLFETAFLGLHPDGPSAAVKPYKPK